MFHGPYFTVLRLCHPGTNTICIHHRPSDLSSVVVGNNFSGASRLQPYFGQGRNGAPYAPELKMPDPLIREKKRVR